MDGRTHGIQADGRGRARHVGQNLKRHVWVRTWGQRQQQPVLAHTSGEGGGGGQVFREKLTTSSQGGVSIVNGGTPQSRRH